MGKYIIAIVGAFAAIFMAGCAHNTGALSIGTRANIGIDPQNFTASLTYVDGLDLVDISRENSAWTLEIEADTGIGLENGRIKGIKRIKRELGPQITGYLVDLSKNSPQLAAAYLEALKYYWQYKAIEAKNAEKSEK